MKSVQLVIVSLGVILPLGWVSGNQLRSRDRGLEPVLKVGGTGYQPVCGGNLPPKHPAGW